LPADITQGWVTINQGMGGGWPPSELDGMSVDDYGFYLEEAIKILKEQRPKQG